jgi:PIN domain nuclease of toxin-antitoxin system
MSGRRYLVDTHILIWALEQDPRVPDRYLALLADGSSCYVSMVTLWEIAIKKSIGKLKIRDDLIDVLQDGDIEILPLNLSHIATYETLPHHHRDPFDRMLIAQAMSEKFQILTTDRNFPLYDVAVA